MRRAETTGILAGDFILTAMMILTLGTTVMVMIEQVMVSRGKGGVRELVVQHLL